ncbi:TPA: type VI secretion system baseplate subunit TssF, partial [Klebsiella pneumoniae]|nr:type VI secretion system baseplate subunit TssF [Klebsiella pneumoniae]
EDGRSFRGYQLLLEYFTFREKFMFIDLRGLETVAFPAGLAWFEIDVVLAERWEHDFRFSEKQLRLHCVPVINLFPLESDPLTINSLQTEYPLRPMRVQDGHTEIYTVDSVISSHQQVYAPFSSFRHKGGMMRHDAADYYYHTRVRRGPSGLYNTWLIVGGEAFDNHTVPEDESLSLTLTGTNGQLPRRALQSTVLDTVMKTTSASIAVRNLCAPTLPCYPPAQDRFHWRVLSHLGSSFLSLMDNAEVLRGTLALYEWTDSEMNRRRLEAILDVKHRATERFAQGHLVRGVQIEVTLDSHGFAGRGDICLFGEMLSRFFALYTDIYLFNRLIIILQPTGERLEWEEKHSRRIPG